MKKNRFVTVIAGVFALGLVLAGCSNAPDSLPNQYKEGSNKNYIAGDGSWTEVKAADRGEPVVYAGVSEHGNKISSTDMLGDIVVVNFWYAGCAPCRAEAEDLQSVYSQFKDEGVKFVGVNVYDQADTALAFNKTFGITYPSIMDIQDGAVKLAFTGEVRPNAVPTTLVIDREGRVAARILGQLQDRSILETLVKDNLAAAK